MNPEMVFHHKTFRCDLCGRIDNERVGKKKTATNVSGGRPGFRICRQCESRLLRDGGIKNDERR